LKNNSEENYKCIIITDPSLAAYCFANKHLKKYFKKGYVHNMVEFNENSDLINIADVIVQLPNNFTFITVLENTLNPKIM
jgi:hypothetical protein